MKLLLIRGLPGSGKSTYAKNLSEKESFVHVEADMWFLHLNGEYKFDPRQLEHAHAWCEQTTEKALKNNANVIVSNTFTSEWEILPYCHLAQTLRADFIVYKTTGVYQNIHNCPQEKIEQMKTRWQDWPGEIFV